MKKALSIFFCFFVVMILPSIGQDSIKKKKEKTWSVGIFSSYEKYPTKPTNTLNDYYDLSNLPAYKNYGYGFGITIEKQFKIINCFNISTKIGTSWNYRGLYYSAIFYEPNQHIDFPPYVHSHPHKYYLSKEVANINIPLLIYANYKYHKLTIGIGFGINLSERENTIVTTYLLSDNSVYEIEKTKGEYFDYRGVRNSKPDCSYFLNALNIKYKIMRRLQIEYAFIRGFQKQPFVDKPPYFDDPGRGASGGSKWLYYYNFSKGIFTHQLTMAFKF